jgi:hypothetical protein
MRVDARLSNLYAELESGSRLLTRKVARVLFMTVEHEACHTEAGIVITSPSSFGSNWNHRHSSICLYSARGQARFRPL